MPLPALQTACSTPFLHNIGKALMPQTFRIPVPGNPVAKWVATEGQGTQGDWYGSCLVVRRVTSPFSDLLTCPALRAGLFFGWLLIPARRVGTDHAWCCLGWSFFPAGLAPIVARPQLPQELGHRGSRPGHRRRKSRRTRQTLENAGLLERVDVHVLRTTNELVKTGSKLAKSGRWATSYSFALRCRPISLNCALCSSLSEV
jgi:hypothetical protein